MQRGRYLSLALCIGALVLPAAGAYAANANGLPDGWTNQDVAATKPATAGTTTVAGTGPTAVWTITGTGGDVWGAADPGFQYAYTNLSGDGGVTARLLTQVGGADTDWSKNGTMLRESADPTSADAFLSYASATGGKDAQTFQPSWKSNTNGKPLGTGASNPSDSYGTDAVEPINGTRRVEKGAIYMRTQRQGKTYQHLISYDGQSWLLLGSETVNIDPTKTILAGIWTSQGGSKKPNVTTWDNVAVDNNVVQAAASNIVPAPANLTAVAGDGAVLISFAPAQGAAGTDIYRQAVGSTKLTLVNAAPTRNGFVVDTGATNGTTYLYTAKSVVDLTAFGGKVAESVAPASAQAMAQPQPAIGGFNVQYGGVITPATLSVASNVLTLTAAGSPIWDTNANGTFVAQPVSGDYSISTKILTPPTRQAGLALNSDTKVGPMIRANAGVVPGDDYSWAFTADRKDGNGVILEGRPSGAKSAAYSETAIKESAVTYPLWLILTKTGAKISAYSSEDNGTTFQAVGTVHDYGLLPATTYAGIGATSGDAKKTMTTTLDASSIQIAAPFTPPAPKM